jgi:UTP--glucose-1-phosphate uridylyltransferase
MARVTKAVITAAGMGTRHFPATATIQKEMFPLVDRDGTTKPTIQIIVEEVVESGVEEICIVASAENLDQFQRHFRGLPEELAATFRGKTWALEEAEKLAAVSQRIRYVIQGSREGYGHAVYCAKEFVGEDPFLLLLGDHIYISATKKTCSRQLIDVYNECGCAVSGVQRTEEDLLHLFGTVAGRRTGGGPEVYELTEIKEKPTLEYAEEHLRTPGLARGQYLCFFGLHVLPPSIFDAIEYHMKNDIRERGEIQLTNAQEMLRSQERYVAVEVNGQRYDMGVPFGYIQTQLALALNSPARRNVLSALPHLLTIRDLDALQPAGLIEM